MMRTWMPLFAAGALLLGGQLRAGEGGDKEYTFERGEKYDLEKGIVIKDVKTDYKKKAKDEAAENSRTVAYHVQNLKDPDPEVRESSAEMLGMLADPTAVPYLIESLREERVEMVAVKCNAALSKITGKDFGYKNYAAWNSWWRSSGEAWTKKAQTGPSEMKKIRARNSNTLGLQYLKSGQYVQANRMFLDAVSSDPEIPDYRNNLGLSVMEIGRYLDGIVYFREAIGLNDGLPQPYMNIGTCYARMNRHIEAQHWYRKAMDKDKNGKLWEPLWTLGKEFLRKGNFNMAWEFLDQARVKAEANRIHDARIYRDLALTHYGLDQFHSAWKEIQNVRTLGYELDEGFVEKVRKALVAQGVDPEAEDAKAREPMQAP